MRIASPAGSNARYDAALRGDGLLEITIGGVWKADEVDSFFLELAPLHRAARVRHARVCTLVKVESVQSPAVAMRVREHAVALKRPTDRNAFVIASFLSKLQIKRLATSSHFAVFTEVTAAESWLKS